MCTTIALTAEVTGSAKGTPRWLAVDRVYLAYDHPAHVAEEHAVLLDFVNEAAGLGTRVAIELGRESARELARQLLETVDQADAYEA